MGETKLKRIVSSICALVILGSLLCITVSSGLPARSLHEYCPVSSPVEPSSSNNTSAIRRSADRSESTSALPSDIAEELPATMKLSFSETPALGEVARLDLVLEPEADAPNTEVRIVLPEGFSLSSGSLQWIGDLSKDVPIRTSVYVRAEAVGDWRIGAAATSRPSCGYPKVCSTTCRVQVCESGGRVFDSSSAGSSRAEAVELDGCGSAGYVGESLSGNVTVRGYWFYKDLVGANRPVRQAKVELYAAGTPADALLARTSVRNNGYYEFPPVSNNGSSPESGRNIYVRLYCESYPYYIVKIGESGGLTPTWFDTDVHYNVSDGYHDMGTWVVTEAHARESWAAYDCIIDSYFWLLNKTGWSRWTVRVTTQDPGGLSLCLGDQIILAPTAGWYRDTVIHEYGHCVNYAARGGSFPPSGVTIDIHYPDTEADGGWAFREGWAEFFPCAVDNTTVMCGGGYGSIETTVYADNPFGHGNYHAIWDGNVVEGAVAQVFWDIFDGISPSDYPYWDEPYGDYISNGFDQLWHVFLTHDPNNIQEFWAQWTPKDVRIWAIFHHARMLEPRDISVTNMALPAETTIMGDTLNINVTLENDGATTEVFNLTATTSQAIISQLHNVTLESGHSAQITLTCDTDALAKGDHTLSVEAVLFPSDLNTTNNARSGAFTLVSCGYDVGLSNITMSKLAGVRGYIFTIRMDARNFGSQEVAFNITATANSTTIGIYTNILLVSGQSTILTLEWNTTLIQKGNYTISITVSMNSNDTDPADNSAQWDLFVTIPGDVDADFNVDIFDVVKITGCYNKRQGDPLYDLGADIDENGIINIFDVVICTGHYGQKRP